VLCWDVKTQLVTSIKFQHNVCGNKNDNGWASTRPFVNRKIAHTHAKQTIIQGQDGEI